MQSTQKEEQSLTCVEHPDSALETIDFGKLLKPEPDPSKPSTLVSLETLAEGFFLKEILKKTYKQKTITPKDLRYCLELSRRFVVLSMIKHREVSGSEPDWLCAFYCMSLSLSELDTMITAFKPAKVVLLCWIMCFDAGTEFHTGAIMQRNHPTSSKRAKSKKYYKLNDETVYDWHWEDLYFSFELIWTNYERWDKQIDLIRVLVLRWENEKDPVATLALQYRRPPNAIDYAKLMGRRLGQSIESVVKNSRILDIKKDINTVSESDVTTYYRETEVIDE